MKKVQFVLVLLVFFMASLLSPSMADSHELRLPYCKVDADCKPICQNCGLCICAGGICFRGCDGGKVNFANEPTVAKNNGQ
ncbi:hypothetical protein CDL12_07812 [Handroanthus impetiginosus]|uniref:Uncharacterized protein n=1 Tax=Handroanthus impetiginosus TaxID=429701 RepID=A0A2G9HPR0_9LAMI|nr:hypothetical protein CDL12_07812 [Handroanthus impetiginosus]